MQNDEHTHTHTLHTDRPRAGPVIKLLHPRGRASTSSSQMGVLLLFCGGSSRFLCLHSHISVREAVVGCGGGAAIYCSRRLRRKSSRCSLSPPKLSCSLLFLLPSLNFPFLQEELPIFFALFSLQNKHNTTKPPNIDSHASPSSLLHLLSSFALRFSSLRAHLLQNLLAPLAVILFALWEFATFYMLFSRHFLATLRPNIKFTGHN